MLVFINNTYGSPFVIEGILPVDAIGNVTVTIGGKNYTMPVDKGNVTFSIPGLDAGNYTVTVYYSGDNNYNNETRVILATVPPLATMLTVDITNTSYGVPLGFNITFTTVNGEPLNQTVILTLNGVDYPVELVNGSAIKQFPGLGAGDYTWSVNYPGTQNYIFTNKAGNLTVYPVKQY